MCHRFFFACVFLCVWRVGPPVRAAAEPPLSKDRTIIVLVGAAGDVESEKAYADQLGRLLDELSAPGAVPKSLTLIMENPASVDRKFSFPFKVFSNRRESLLSLKGSDPDLVLAWGHGGQQGTEPVLHVPGPRVTPADFLALAAPQSAKTSDWILYFKGSQAFAEALGNSSRRVLASEGEKTFTYDPVGLPLLLQAFPHAAGLSALASLTAKAVDDWYNSRSLAATEQATLWLDGQPVSAPSTDAPAPSPGNAAAKADDPVSTWHSPPPVDPAAYTQADAVILHESIQAVIGDNPQLSQEEERYIQILTPEGKRFGDLDLAFSPPEENLTIIDCEIRQPDGRVEPVDTGAHDEGPAPDAPTDYPATQRKFFSVPNVVPGAIVHVHQRREWKHFPLPKVYLTLPLASELPILDKTLEVRVPTGQPFRFAWKNPPGGAAPDPKVERSAYGSIYRWRFGAIPALPDDPLQPHDNEPALLTSTFGDWTEFLTWYQGLIRESGVATPDMVDKARDLTRGCHDDLDKIRELFRYVTGLRYVAVPLGVNAYRPHAAANVFYHRYGDCKDKANLLNVLLTSQGFDAQLVLAPRFAVALPEVPGAAFNHAISHVNLHGKSLWLDSTDDICRFGLLPPGDPDRHVLVIANNEKELRTLPLPPPQDSRLDLTRSLTLTASGTVEDKGEARATGIMDYQLRAAARHFGGVKACINLLDGLVRPPAGVETLRRQTFLGPSEMGQDFTWIGDSTWDGLVSALPAGNGAGKGGRLVRAPFVLPAEWTIALQPRTTGLYLDQGYPCEIIQRVTLHLGGEHAPGLPAGGESSTGPLQYRLQWTRTDSATIAATLTLTLAQADLSPEETAVFQGEVHALHQILAQGVLLSELPLASKP